MNPRQCTEYDNINFLMTTTVTTPQNELSGSRLTQANYLCELEKHHQQLESQAATAFNTVYDNLESTITTPQNGLRQF
ncbi:hypothetical protein F4X33_01730 [Candidatus Poribacteria bacterium]|nr:hypothetical protein [Candidatus Poribacteria bacterium]